MKQIDTFHHMGTTDKQPNSPIHFRQMIQLSLNCVSLGLGGSRSKVKRASRSETLMVTQLIQS